MTGAYVDDRFFLIIQSSDFWGLSAVDSGIKCHCMCLCGNTRDPIDFVF